MKQVQFFLIILVIALTSWSSNALTFKKGEVLGSDGKVYEGASPTQMERLITRAKKGGETAGVAGQNVFIVVDDGVVFVPVSDLAGKKKETIEVFITASVVAKVVQDTTDVKLEVEDLAVEIDVAKGNIEDAVSTLIERVANQTVLELPAIASDIIASTEAQQLSNEEAVAELMGESVSIESAVASWSTLSTADKQTLVDAANKNGILGCADCSIEDAEEFVKEVAQNSGIDIESALSDAINVNSQIQTSSSSVITQEAVSTAVAATQSRTVGFRPKNFDQQQASIQQQAEFASRQQRALAAKVAADINRQSGALASARAQRSAAQAQAAVSRLSEAETKATLEQAYRDAAKQTENLVASGALSQKIDAVIGAAIEAVDRVGDDIDQAISAWDSMSDAQKQALVDKVNREGLLGCTSCTVEDAEAYANSKR